MRNKHCDSSYESTTIVLVTRIDHKKIIIKKCARESSLLYTIHTRMQLTENLKVIFFLLEIVNQFLFIRFFLSEFQFTLNVNAAVYWGWGTFTNLASLPYSCVRARSFRPLSHSHLLHSCVNINMFIWQLAPFQSM